MIKVEFTSKTDEIVDATLDFVSRRPFVSIIFVCMQICSILVCFSFALKLYTNQNTTIDLLVALFAVYWIFGYKKFQKSLIRFNINKRKEHTILQRYQINKKSINRVLPSTAPLQAEWKKIRYIYRNKLGYIIPLTGIRHAGKFIWLPQSGFQSQTMENDFNNLLQTLKIKVKNIRAK